MTWKKGGVKIQHTGQLSSARLKQFFRETVFGFYFQNTIPQKNRNRYNIWVIDSTRLKKFFHGTAFRFYFQNTVPQKNRKTLARSAHQHLLLIFFYFSVGQHSDFIFQILSHGKTLARSARQHLVLASFLFFPWDSICIFLWNSISILYFSVVRKDPLDFYRTLGKTVKYWLNFVNFHSGLLWSTNCGIFYLKR